MGRAIKSEMIGTVCLVFVRCWCRPSIALDTPGKRGTDTDARYWRWRPQATDKLGGFLTRDNPFRSNGSGPGPALTMVDSWLTQSKRRKQPMQSSEPFARLPVPERFNSRESIDRRGDATAALQVIIVHGVTSICGCGFRPTKCYPDCDCRIPARADRPCVRLRACGPGRCS